MQRGGASKCKLYFVAVVIMNPPAADRTAIIYLIQGPSPGLRYIGCTSQSINLRFTKHKSRAKKADFRNALLYKAMQEHGVNNFTIEAIKTVPYALRADEEALAILDRGTIGPNGLNLRLPNRPVPLLLGP